MNNYLVIIAVFNILIVKTYSNIVFNLEEISCTNKKKNNSDYPCRKFNYLLSRYYNSKVICKFSNFSNLTEIYSCYPSFGQINSYLEESEKYLKTDYELVKIDDKYKLTVEVDSQYNYQILIISILFIIYVIFIEPFIAPFRYRNIYYGFNYYPRYRYHRNLISYNKSINWSNWKKVR